MKRSPRLGSVIVLAMLAASARAEFVYKTQPLGMRADAIAVNPVTNRIYVTHSSDHAVTVIDGATHSAEVIPIQPPTGGGAPSSVAINTVTNKVYVSGTLASNTITEIDGATNATHHIYVGGTAMGVTVNPATNKIYVHQYLCQCLSVVDGSTRTYTTLMLPGTVGPVAVNPVTNRVYVHTSSTQVGNKIVVLDGSNDSTITSVAAGNNFISAAVSAATNKVFFLLGVNGFITVLDGADNSTQTIFAGLFPATNTGSMDIGVNEANNRVYVANQNTSDVTVIDAVSLAKAWVPAQTWPDRVAINPNTNKIYVSNAGSGSVTVINGRSNSATTLVHGLSAGALAVNPENGRAYVAHRLSHSLSVIATHATRSDLDGDRRADLLWRNEASGENYLYPMDGTQVLGEGYVRTAGLLWYVAGTGDFNGDGKIDILWRNLATGENYIFLMNGLSVAGEGYLRTIEDPDWRVAGVADFDGDGKEDILWRNAATGENYLYPMDGLTIRRSEGYLHTVASPDWRIAGIADFDGDGKADVLWRNSVYGENYLWPMDGRTIKSTEGHLRTVADTRWEIKAVADFDGDGRADIFWRHASSGENYLFPMAGRTVKATEGYVRTVPDPTWQVARAGDFDGDGRSDVLWRNSSTGENYLYPMVGTEIKPSEGFVRTVPPSPWRLVP